MRILLVHNRYRSAQPSGENQVVELEAALLARAGHQVIRYEADSDDISRYSIGRKASVPGRVVWSPGDRRLIGSVMEAGRPDVVHVHNTFPLISPSVLGACTRLGVPVVATLHNFRLVCANGLLLREGMPCELCVGRSPWPGVVHACYRGSRAATLPIALGIQVHSSLGTWTRGVSTFIALSSFARGRFVAAGLPGPRIEVKPNSVPRPICRREGPGRHFLFIGRLSREKGADLLLEAWRQREEELLVVGDGPERPALESEASSSRGNIRFLGQLSHERSLRLLLDARALVAPSRSYEMFPLTVAEAYSHRVPVIAPRLGSFPEVILDGESGLLFVPGSPEDLAEKAGQLSDAATSIRMGLAAAAIYEERYTEEGCLESLEGIYRRAVGQPRRRGRRTKNPPDDLIDHHLARREG